MPEFAKPSRATLLPVLRYRDVDAAVRRLTDVLGFTDAGIYRGDDGRIVHAQLAFGNGMVMLGPIADTAFGRFMVEPATAGGVTQSIFAITADPDELHRRAVAAGLEIVLPLRDESYGSREFTLRDPEGHVWTFGTFDPWAEAAG